MVIHTSISDLVGLGVLALIIIFIIGYGAYLYIGNLIRNMIKKAKKGEK